MQTKDRVRFTHMSRPEFIHFAKDFLFIMFDRGSASELKTIISLVIEDIDFKSKQEFVLTIEQLYRELKHTWQPNLQSLAQPSNSPDQQE